MASHLAMNSLEVRPKPVIRRNRNPSSSELPYIREEQALNESLVAQLQQVVEERTTRLRDARANVEMKGIECEHAQLRLQTTTSFRDKLIKTRETFSLSANLPTTNDMEQLISALDDVSPNLLAVSDSLNMGSEFMMDLERRIEEANLAVRLAQDAVARSLEEEQEALMREEQCSSLLDIIQKTIDEIATIGQAQNSRVLFRLHDEIWWQIFLEVVHDVEPTNRFPSVTISSVSHSWRVRVLAYPALWRDIHIRAHNFSSKDVDRVLQYRRRSGDSLLRITLQLEEVPSDHSLGLLLQSLTGIGAVDVLLIKGGPGATSVVGSTLEAIRQLKTLEIAYPPESSPAKYRLPHHISEGLDKLILHNCSLTSFRGPEQGGGAFRLVSLAVVRPASSRNIKWNRFCSWLEKSAATLEYLELDATFTDHQPSSSAPPVVFSRLNWVIASPELLLLLFRSSFHTPSLRKLGISRTTTFDVDAWRGYAADARGGMGINTIGVLPKIGVNNMAAYTSCLKSLPYLESLQLHSKNVEPLLDALTSHEDTNNSRPLANLNELNICNYTGEGDHILRFAIQYQSTSNTHNPSSGAVASTLRVRLEGCPNVSSHVLLHLREIGSIN